jgi:hypothetical protein
LNLNIFAAVTGVFSGKGKKTTDTMPDGSSHSEEEHTGKGKMRGAGAGTLNAVENSNSEFRERHRLTDEVTAAEKDTHVAKVDHLGIEDGPKK